MCSICFLIIIEAIVINPYSYAYYYTYIEHCLQSNDDCPNYFCLIQRLICLQYTNNIIYNLAKNSEFNKDDIMYYLKCNSKIYLKIKYNI